MAKKMGGSRVGGKRCIDVGESELKLLGENEKRKAS